MALGFWINNKNCYGCKTCSIACKSEKQLNLGVLQRRVVSIRQDDPLAVSFISMSCNHCEDPACVSNCPVGAYTKLESGIVQQDHDLCIGCKMCIEACPYNAPCYDEETSRTFKCDMCIDRQEQGLLPACVDACPGANLAIGEMEDLQNTYQADIVSDENSGTNPNFVITADPLLTAEPDDTAMEELDVPVELNQEAIEAAGVTSNEE